MEIEKIRARLQKLIDEKKTNKSKASHGTGLGYFTIRNVLDINYKFEAKASTLKKIETYLDEIEKK